MPLILENIDDYEKIIFFEDPDLKGETIKIIKKYQNKLQEIINLKENIEELEEICNIDVLTGLNNRRYLDEQFTKDINSISRGLYKESSLGVAIIDIDNFKSINDTYGHEKGDEALKKLSEILKKEFRNNDTIIKGRKINKENNEVEGNFGRWGGEEFLIIIPGISQNNFQTKLEKIHNLIKNEFKIETDGTNKNITVTIGGATKEINEKIINEKEIDKIKNKILKTADNNLYEGKNRGKNTVIVK